MYNQGEWRLIEDENDEVKDELLDKIIDKLIDRFIGSRNK